MYRMIGFKKTITHMELLRLARDRGLKNDFSVFSSRELEDYLISKGVYYND